jgi:hypothetical protein
MKLDKPKTAALEELALRFRDEEERLHRQLAELFEEERRRAARLEAARLEVEQGHAAIVAFREETKGALERGLSVDQLGGRDGFEGLLKRRLDGSRERQRRLAEEQRSAIAHCCQRQRALAEASGRRVAVERELSEARRLEAQAAQDRVDEEIEGAAFLRSRGEEWEQ